VQTAASGCEGFLTLQELTPFPSSGCAGGLVAPNLMTSCPNLRCVYFCLASCRMECDPSGYREE